MIPDNIFDDYFEFVDELLINDNISDEATLYYVVKSNVIGFDSTENISSETVRIRVYENPKNWNKNGGIEFINGRCKIIGTKEVLDKIRNCSYLSINNLDYKLATEPMSHGFKSSNKKYYSAFIDLK